MKPAAIDQKLTELRAAADAINATLLEIELDPIRRALDDATLEGESDARWADASRQLTQLWQWYLQLDALLKRATEVRGVRARLSPRQEAELTELLTGPSIEFVADDVPVVQRQLLGASQAERRCTPDDHLTRMSATFDEAKTVVAAIGNAWELFPGRIRALNVGVAKAAEHAEELGSELSGELARIRREVIALSERLARDPLSVTSDQIEQLDAALAALRVDIEAIAVIRQELDARIEATNKLRQDLGHALERAAAAHQEVLVKVVAPDVPVPTRVEPSVDAQLAEVRELGRRCAWREADAALDAWVARVGALIEDADRVAAQNRAPIEARNQLRGLLSAYEGKAKHLRLIEDPTLAAMFRAARDCLYTAPTDLVLAAELVQRYQRALADHPKTREVLM